MVGRGAPFFRREMRMVPVFLYASAGGEDSQLQSLADIAGRSRRHGRSHSIANAWQVKHDSPCRLADAVAGSTMMIDNKPLSENEPVDVTPLLETIAIKGGS